MYTQKPVISIHWISSGKKWRSFYLNREYLSGEDLNNVFSHVAFEVYRFVERKKNNNNLEFNKTKLEQKKKQKPKITVTMRHFLLVVLVVEQLFPTRSLCIHLASLVFGWAFCLYILYILIWMKIIQLFEGLNRVCLKVNPHFLSTWTDGWNAHNQHRNNYILIFQTIGWWIKF